MIVDAFAHSVVDRKAAGLKRLEFQRKQRGLSVGNDPVRAENTDADLSAGIIKGSFERFFRRYTAKFRQRPVIRDGKQRRAQRSVGLRGHGEIKQAILPDIRRFPHGRPV